LTRHVKTIYCISGLGTDEKVFGNLNVNAKMKFIPWLRPLKNETIKKYASRMGESIHDSSAVILGISFGGMIAIEIAKQIPVEKLIIVSSIKTASELPGWMKLTGKFQLHKILPTRSYKITEKYDNSRLGITNEEERQLVNMYRQKMDPVYYDWAVHQVLSWKNSWYPENLVHIHGEQDKVFPIKNLAPTHVIKDGSHIMTLNKAEEVSTCINSVL